MRKLNILITILAFLMFMNTGNAQTYKVDTKTSFEKAQNNSFQHNFITSQNALIVSSENNVVRIQQIGNYNNVLSNTHSNSSDIAYTQIGNNNDVFNNASSNRIEENVVQIGDNHAFIDLNNVSSQFHSAKVYQYGSNQNLIWLGGENSISDKMIVSMKGQSQTIIVRNLNN